MRALPFVVGVSSCVWLYRRTRTFVFSFLPLFFLVFYHYHLFHLYNSLVLLLLLFCLLSLPPLRPRPPLGPSFLSPLSARRRRPPLSSSFFSSSSLLVLSSLFSSLFIVLLVVSFSCRLEPVVLNQRLDYSSSDSFFKWRAQIEKDKNVHMYMGSHFRVSLHVEKGQVLVNCYRLQTYYYIPYYNCNHKLQRRCKFLVLLSPSFNLQTVAFPLKGEFVIRVTFNITIIVNIIWMCCCC